MGLRVAGDCDISVIVVDFPKSRDGRGFTWARLLRERHGFDGDIRAAGPMLPDQFAMLLECGFTSLLAPENVPLERWQEAALLRGGKTRPRTFLEKISSSSVS